MLRRWRYSNLVLNDPAVEAQIAELARRRSRTPGSLIRVTLVGGLTGGLLGAACALAFPFRGLFPLVAIPIIVSLAVLASRHVEARRAAAWVPEVLRSLGRCDQCGYHVGASGSEHCPECGTPCGSATVARHREAASPTEESDGPKCDAG